MQGWPHLRPSRRCSLPHSLCRMLHQHPSVHSHRQASRVPLRHHHHSNIILQDLLLQCPRTHISLHHRFTSIMLQVVSHRRVLSSNRNSNSLCRSSSNHMFHRLHHHKCTSQQDSINRLSLVECSHSSSHSRHSNHQHLWLLTSHPHHQHLQSQLDRQLMLL